MTRAAESPPVDESAGANQVEDKESARPLPPPPSLAECIRVAKDRARKLELDQQVFVSLGDSPSPTAMHEAACLDRLALMAEMVMRGAHSDKDLAYKLARHGVKLLAPQAKK